MYPIDKIIELLLYRKEEKLANMLVGSDYDFNESSTYGSRWNSTLTTVNIYSPLKYYDKLLTISEKEKQVIIKAFHVIYPVKDNEIEINNIEFYPHPENAILEDEKPIIPKKAVEADYWEKGFYRLFISHSSKIKDRANQLKKALFEYSISGFVAHDDIEPSKEWQTVIEDALITCDGLVALLNDDFPNSRWTDQEVGICYALKKTIIPIRLGIDPYGFMGKYQGLQGYNKEMDSIASGLFKLLLKNEKANEQISRSIINKFIDSSSYLESRSNLTLLESVTYLNEQLLEELKKSKNHNSQIKYSFGVPDRLDNFVKSWKTKLNIK